MALNHVMAPEGKMFKQGDFTAVEMYLGVGDSIDNYEIVDYVDPDAQEPTYEELKEANDILMGRKPI